MSSDRHLHSGSENRGHRRLLPLWRRRERLGERGRHLVSNSYVARALSIRSDSPGGLLRARSTIDAFEKLGYTLLYSYRELEALELYQAFPKLVRIVIMDAVLISNCLHFNRPQLVPLKEITSGRFRQLDREGWESYGLVEPTSSDMHWGESMMEGKERHEGCIRRGSYPAGIPLWKTLA